MAYVVAKVQTADEVQTVAVAQIYTFLVRRYKAIPLVVVVLTGHDHVGAGGRSCVHVLDGAVVKGAVGTAEFGVQHAVRRAIPVAAVAVASIAFEAVALGIRHVERCGERLCVVDLPDVTQRDLGLVVDVVVRRALTALVVETVGRVVAIHAFAVHIVLYCLPAEHAEAVVARALVVLLRCAEGCQR